MKPVAILLLLIMAGCTGWRTAASRSINGAKSLARSSEQFADKHCVTKDIVAECRAAGDAKCEKLTRCETVYKSLLTFQTALLLAQHALIETATTKQAVQAMVLIALKTYQPVKEAIEAWK